MSKEKKYNKVALMCPRCFYKFNKTLANQTIYINNKWYAKKCVCDYKGPLIEIDINLSTPIMLLNSHGLYTKYCCEGHTDKNGDIISTPYISFEPYIVKNNEELELFKNSLPESWYYDNDPYIINPGIIIRADMIFYPNYIDDISDWVCKVINYLDNKKFESNLNCIKDMMDEIVYRKELEDE